MLSELLAEEKPGVRGKDNAFYVMDKPELETISQALPRFMWPRLKLPILIEMSPDFGSGACRVQGEMECIAISNLLNQKRPKRDFMIIYMPDVRALRRILPTTTQYAFVANLRSAEGTY